MNRSAILEARGLSIRRGRQLIYDDITFDLHEGVTALLGPNGAGKSTLLDALSSPQRVGRGYVALDGEALMSDDSYRRYKSRTGHMPQDWRFFRGFTAQESVEYVAWLKAVPRTQLRAAARHALASVDLSEQSRTLVRRLSGGMQQRVGLAEALVNNPRLALLDEPTVGLDPAQRAHFRDVLISRKSGRAIVLSTHLTDDVQAMADRVLVVDHGHIVFDGIPADLAAQSPDPHARSLENGYLSVISHASPGRSS
ncbi:ABC transporter ATP-binding protein [Paramicrobacterium sp. CJ85]|uniref:ABC transporter ATP-binding protein n=1 Tax=Paramicrobacterium sp. CJ85 TaxID=3445355 RepID=UPI003F62EF40